MRIRRVPTALVATVALLGACLAACRDDEASAPSAAPTASPAPTVVDATVVATTDEPTAAPESTAPAEPTERACRRFPADGPGSFAALARQPAGTALANVPSLSAFLAAVEAAGLLPALDDPGPLTIFAPVNRAFAAIPTEQLDAMLTDSETIHSILVYHAVAEQLSRGQLAAAQQVDTIGGRPLRFAERRGRLRINGGEATVTCSNIRTANATVHLIDAVLMPPP